MKKHKPIFNQYRTRFVSFDFEKCVADDRTGVTWWGWHAWATHSQFRSPFRIHYSWTPRFSLGERGGAERRLSFTFGRRYSMIGFTFISATKSKR